MASQQPPPPPPPRGGGMSLYANLLDSSEGAAAPAATISRAPVVFDPKDGTAADSSKDGDGSTAPSGGPKKDVNAAFRFQPMIRRPVAPQKKPNKPMAFPKTMPPSAAAPDAVTATSSATTATQSSLAQTPGPSAAGLEASSKPEISSNGPTKTTLADWAATRDDDYLYNSQHDQPKRKRKKNKKGKREERVETDWDELYDPSRPTNVEEYLRSDERIREVREWKDVLYRHRRKREKEENKMMIQDEDQKSCYSEDEEEDLRPRNNTFAPPSSYNFAPPPPSSPRAAAPNDSTGEDAYARRLALSRGEQPPPPPPPAPPSASHEEEASETGGGYISRAPVRYTDPQPGPELMDTDPPPEAAEEDDQYSPPPSFFSAPSNPTDPNEPPAKSTRPGQSGFAHRLMSKYGWSAGTGLGASSSGIINPLSVRVEKRRRKPDSEGGGWADPSARAKITGGQVSSSTREQQRKDMEEGDAVGKMSEVIVLRGMLDGMGDDEVEEEIREGVLQQEIGEECGEKYGRVERLHIDTSSGGGDGTEESDGKGSGRRVYIKFTDQVSALRAVNALQGRIFNGNAIVAKFFDTEKFEKRDFA
ncbi:hypothetical protein MKZ38_010200 [Zalerion maritima]|uniref:G-patch domain-containing protein n=1 Tax=Zalerion maritima TaxID=339359 RepID=A0AAD5WUM4_9PEZI|nr:hypothetical protein MKZ38_010200 [Zalerion maritima]